MLVVTLNGTPQPLLACWLRGRGSGGAPGRARLGYHRGMKRPQSRRPSRPSATSTTRRRRHRSDRYAGPADLRGGALGMVEDCEANMPRVEDVELLHDAADAADRSMWFLATLFEEGPRRGPGRREG